MDYSSQNLKTFLNKPKYFQSMKIDWNQFVLLILLYFLLALVATIPIAALKFVFPFEHVHANTKALSMFFGAVILAPVAEELMFRLLLKPISSNLIIFVIFSLPFSIYLGVNGNYFIFAAITLFQISIIALLNISQKYLFRIQRHFIRHFKYFYYFSIVSFGFLHIMNFNFDEINIGLILLSPIFVVPQLILGSILGFIRIKFGFIYAIAFHASINGILTFFAALGEII